MSNLIAPSVLPLGRGEWLHAPGEWNKHFVLTASSEVSMLQVEFMSLVFPGN